MSGPESSRLLRIGAVVCDPPVVLAPMAGITNPPFRRICRDMGAGLVVTEMIAARGLHHRAPKCMEMLQLDTTEHPVCVQIYGKDPEIMASAARVVQQAGADMVDVNMGCPMRKVVGSGHGAALLKQPALVHQIVRAMAEAVTIPVTIKMRAGWENSQVAEVGRAVEDAGGAAVTIHGRTRTAGYSGHVDLDHIAELVDAVEIPVIGNGDVRDPESAARMLGATQCAGLMVGRGCLGYPWIFRELAAHARGEEIPDSPSLAERRRVIGEHVRGYAEVFGEQRTCREIRKHLLWYFRDTPAEPVIRSRVAALEHLQTVLELVDRALEACDHPSVVFARGLDRHPNA